MALKPGSRLAFQMLSENILAETTASDTGNVGTVNTKLCQQDALNANEPDVATMRRFLAALGRGEDADHGFGAVYRRGGAPGRIQGTLDDCLEQLLSWDRAGEVTGLYVNSQGLKPNSERKTKANVIEARALMVEFDGQQQPEPTRLAQLPKPSAVVQSKNGQHFWWFLQAGEAIEQVEPALKRLINYLGSDPQCKDCTRIMRVPGSIHRKDADAPFMVTLEAFEPNRRYIIAEVLANVPELPSKPARKVAPKPHPELSEPTGKRGSSVEADELAAKLRKLPRERQLQYIYNAIAGRREGGRNALLHAGARLAYGFVLGGIPEQWLRERLTLAARKAGLQDGEIEATINSAFGFAAQHGLGLKGARQLWHSFEQHYGSGARFNTRDMSLSLDGDRSVDLGVERINFIERNAGGLQPSPDRFEAELVPWVKKRASYDPVREYFDALPEMTVEAAHSELGALVNVMGIESEHERMVVKRWLVGTVARTFEPGCVFPWVLVLKGLGGAGKSSFFENLAPLGYHRTIKALDAHGIDRDELMKANKSAIYLIDELDKATRRADISTLKTFVVERESTYREPYARTDRTHPRAFSIGATCNLDQPLTDDDAGLRRWIAVAMPGGELDGRRRAAYYQAQRDGVWAAALTLYRAGYGWMLTVDELAVETERKEESISRSLVFAKAMAELPVMAERMASDAQRGQAEAFHFEQLEHIFGTRDRLSSSERSDLREALKRCGWVQKRMTFEGRPQLWVPETVPTSGFKGLASHV